VTRRAASNHGVHEPRRRRVQLTAPRSPANLRLRRARTSTRSDPSPGGRATSARRPAAGTLGLSSSRARRDGHTSSEMAGLAFGARACICPRSSSLNNHRHHYGRRPPTPAPPSTTLTPLPAAPSSRVYTVAVEQQQPAKGTAVGQHQEQSGCLFWTPYVRSSSDPSTVRNMSGKHGHDDALLNYIYRNIYI